MSVFSFERDNIKHHCSLSVLSECFVVQLFEKVPSEGYRELLYCCTAFSGKLEETFDYSSFTTWEKWHLYRFTGTADVLAKRTSQAGSYAYLSEQNMSFHREATMGLLNAILGSKSSSLTIRERGKRGRGASLLRFCTAVTSLNEIKKHFTCKTRQS